MKICRSEWVLPALAALLMGVAIPGQSAEIKAGGITLDVPATWKQEQPTSSMRLAQFTVPGEVEMVVFHFGAQGAGGVEANIQRWVGQFAEDGRDVKRSQGTSPQGDFIRVAITGTYNAPIGPPMLRKTEPRPGSQVIAVILKAKDGDYFLKCSGPQAAVETAGPDLLKSFQGTVTGK